MTRTAEAGRPRIAPARVAAYDVLRAVNGGTADLPHALAQHRGHLADERDRALAGEIVTGTLRWQAAFDHVVAQFTRRPVSRLDAEVLDVLRLSMFQLLHLDRVPASAVVNDAVDLARRAGKKSAAPLVNAVLRRVSRERQKLPLPPRPGDSGDREAQLEYLSIALSHPRWLAARWLDRHGFDNTESWLRFNNSPATLTLRVNTLKTTRAELVVALQAYGVETEPARFAPDGLLVREGNPLLTPLAGEGLFSSRTKRRRSLPPSSKPHPGSVCSMRAPHPGARRSRSPRPSRIAASSSRPIFADVGSICWRGPWPPPGRRRFASSRRTRGRCRLEPGSTGCCWTRRVPAWVPSGAIPTCAGAGTRPT